MTANWLKRADELNPRVCNLVDGCLSEGHGESIEKYGPRDGNLLYRFTGANEMEVDAAVANVKYSVRDGRWSKLPVHRRKDALLRLAALIEYHAEELALLECLDVGKPITDALKFDVPMAAAVIRHAAESADKVFGKVYSVDQGNLSYQLHRPIGVVAGVVGWNFPLLLAAGKIGPVLSMGNGLILKPSELTALSATRIGELAVEAGVPEGVLNVIQGGPGVGAALARHPDVGLISFTGSSQTGKKLLLASGHSNMKRMILECGGKAPNIVFDDSPGLDAVANAVVARAFWNQGQVCTASSRLLIQQTIKDELMGLIIEKVALLNPEDPLQPEARFGALLSREHKRKVEGYIASGEADGTRVAYRGRSSPPNEGGFYVSPVIFDAVASGQKIAQEEIFGPVLSVIGFCDEKEAVEIANSTIYGLSAIVWTKDLGRAHRVTQGIDAGWVVVNATEKPVGGPGVGVLSTGGHKESGIGVEGGIEGLEAYTSKTAVQLFV